MLKYLSHKHAMRAMTLIEVVVSIGIITMISSGVVALQRNIIANSKALQSSLIAQQQTHRALLRFVKEIRTAAPSAGGAYALEAAGTSSITFFANIDNDAAIERVRYFLATSTLYKGVVKPVGTVYNLGSETSSLVVTEVVNSSFTPIFAYYTNDYDGTASSSSLAVPINIPDVRLVKIMLPVDPNGIRPPFFYITTTQVSLRNLKDNL